jgi:type IV secretion system protein VirB5
MDGIEQLRQRLSSASDAKDVLDLQARLQAEQAFLQTDVLRMQGLRMIQQAQVDVNAQRRQEEERRQIDRLGAALR